MTGWGPQHAAGLPSGLRIGRGGGYWWGVVAAAAAALFGTIGSRHDTGGQVLFGLAGAILGATLAVHETHAGDGWASGRRALFVIATLLAPPLGLAYAAVWAGIRAWPRIAGSRTPVPQRTDTTAEPVDPADWPTMAGGFFGLDDSGAPVLANPRGAALIIGPPGAGKTTCSIMQSVAAAPGPVVSTSVKTEVMAATAALREHRGTVWWFDPGGLGGPPPAGVRQLRWAPLVDVLDWSAALAVASRLTGPLRPAAGTGGEDHWLDRAESWLAVLLYAAALGGGIDDLAEWTRGPESSLSHVEALLLEHATLHGDNGAHAAGAVLAGIDACADKERASIASTVARIAKIYQDPAAVAVGRDPNFTAAEFVASQGDTVYITAPTSAQQSYGPLIAGLLESIRGAQEARRQRIDLGHEAQTAPITFALDEAANTAPIPLPSIASTAGGQGMHLVVAIQEPNQVRQRWGTAGDGFLTLFPDRLLLSGLADERWCRMLSDMSGHYDRVTSSVSAGSRGHQQAPGLLLNRTTGVSETGPAVTFQSSRTAQLSVADIATLPPGRGLCWGRSGWQLIHLVPFDPSRPPGKQAGKTAPAADRPPAVRLTGGAGWLATRATPRRILIAVAAAVTILAAAFGVPALTRHKTADATPAGTVAAATPGISPGAPTQAPPTWDGDILSGFYLDTQVPVRQCEPQGLYWWMVPADGGGGTLTAACIGRAWVAALNARGAELRWPAGDDDYALAAWNLGRDQQTGPWRLQLVRVAGGGCQPQSEHVAAGGVPPNCIITASP